MNFRFGIVSILLSILSMTCGAPNTPQNDAQNVNKNPSTDPTTYYGSWPGHTYYPSPPDWRNQTVYQFVTDRWCDGDPSNNDGFWGGYDIGQIGTRHGGDFKGITAQLDYIKALGFTAIWISPIFQNMQNSYHGYGQIDFTLIDDRWGTLDDMREMVTQAHNRGIRVIVDIVVNHMADLYYFEGYPASSAPFRLHTGEYRLIPRNPNISYVDFPIDNTYSSTGSFGTVYDDAGNAVVDTGSGSYWGSDLHHNGDLGNYGDPWQNHLGKIYGTLDDLRTTHPRVVSKITAMTKSLLASTDVDGIRMDTPMQVPLSFFKSWGPAVKAYAASLGKDDFLIYAEFYTSRNRAATMTGRGRTSANYNTNNFIDNNIAFDGGIHYPFYFWFQNAVTNQVNGNLNSVMTDYNSKDSPSAGMYDFYIPARGQNQYRHLNFYNNHDQIRVAQSNDGFLKTDLGSAIITFWPGIPLFYYGDDQGFLTKGTALDGWSREDFMTSAAWSSTTDPVIATVNGSNPAVGDNFDQTNPHFLWIQKLLNIRRAYPVLGNCDSVFERWTQTSNTNGIYIFSRACGSSNEWVMVGWNTWSATLNAGGSIGTLFTGWAAGDVIYNLLNPSESYTLLTNGVLNNITFAGYEVKIFARQVRALNPTVISVTPRHDTVVGCSYYTITIKFSTQMVENSVISAFSFNGSPCPSTPVYNSTLNTLSCLVSNLPDGIHKFSVNETALSTSGLTMTGTFISRFRVGNSLNPIIKRNAVNDNSFVSSITQVGGNWQFNLTLKGTGASLYRIIVNLSGVSWTAWTAYPPAPYAVQYLVPVSQAPLNSTLKLTAQYWADGSTAYWTDQTLRVNPNYAPSGTATPWPSALPCQGPSAVTTATQTTTLTQVTTGTPVTTGSQVTGISEQTTGIEVTGNSVTQGSVSSSSFVSFSCLLFVFSFFLLFV